MDSSLVNFQHDAQKSRQIVESSDQKSLNSELDYQRRSQSRIGKVQAKEEAAALSIDTGLAVL